MASSKTDGFRTIIAGLILTLIVLNGWVLYSSFEQVSAQEAWVAHTAQVKSEMELIISSVKDTSIGISGFLLTKNPDLLQPMRDGKVAIEKHLNTITELTKDNPAQQANITTLRKLVDQRSTTLDQLQKAWETGGLSEQRRNQLLMEARVTLEQLRVQIREMAEEEQALMDSRAGAASRSREIFIWALAITTIVSAGAVAFAFRQFRKHQDRLEEEAKTQGHEAWVKEISAEVARLTATHTNVKMAATEVARLLGQRFGFLASRTFLMDSGGLKLVAEIGCEGTLSATSEKGLIQEGLSKVSTWQITNIPGDHWNIESALGKSKPKSLVFLPLHFQGIKVGVIECAGFTELTDDRIKTLDRITDAIGTGLAAGLSRERLQELLEETQQQAEELQTQQEELRTNNEELEQQTRALESQQQSLNLQNRELEAIRMDLERKADELAVSSQYKSEFLAKMSHELRTPLNGLLILSTLLMENKEKNLNERQLQFAKSINGAGSDLLTLVNDILDLSKIEARKLSLRPESFRLQELLEHKRITFGPQVDAKKLKFDVHVDPEVASQVMFTDRQRLEQIIRNFISNAIKFTDKGGITLSARPSADRKKIEISVSDTGIGIPSDKQRMVFEAFEQVDSSATRNFGGTGLGLTISKELSVLLGGGITLSSTEGKGSTFTLTVPIQMPTDTTTARQIPVAPVAVNVRDEQYERKPAPLVASEAQAVLKNLPKDKKTILIVEDDEKFRSSVKETVKENGFHALEAADGEVALAILENHTPDAVLLDIKLPGISGLGILEMMKQMPQLRHVPVHMISALDYQHNALRRGALGYLTKPVTLEKVRSAVSRIQNFLDKKIRKVLVIEDDQHQSHAIASLISGSDVSVTTTKSGKEAVESLRAEPYDCIILDLTLPDVSGFDLLTELNSLPISLPPIVIYTGKDLTDEEEEYLRKFSESIIIKGARSPERLLDEVNLFLHRIESMLPEDKRAMLTQLRSQEQSFADKTVLIADDDLRNVFALTSALESKGLKVEIAKNGLEAIESLEKHKQIDLVLMDIMMPKMDGYEAMQKIRKSHDSRMKNIPIIALTAKAMREDHERCIEAGANDYLPKPVNLDNLTTALKVWLTPKEGF